MGMTLLLSLLPALALPKEGPPTVRIAVCQILAIDGDRDGNFRRIEYALEQARAGRADIAAFPESIILGWQNPDAHRLATPIPGADSDRIAALARQYGLMICIGLDEKDGGRLYDSAILVGKTGKVLWKHRKLNVLAHLMDPPYAVGEPEGIGAVDTEFGRIGVLICADTFVDAYVDRLNQLKPDLVLVPYGWAAEVDKWPQHEQELKHLVARRDVGMPRGGHRFGGSHLARPLEGANLRRRQRRGGRLGKGISNPARPRCGSARGGTTGGKSPEVITCIVLTGRQVPALRSHV
jgi:N-carbamoylputrescine amidase